MTKPNYPNNPYPEELADGRPMFSCFICGRRYPTRYAFALFSYLFCPFCVPAYDIDYHNISLQTVIRECKELREICDGKDG